MRPLDANLQELHSIPRYHHLHPLASTPTGSYCATDGTVLRQLVFIFPSFFLKLTGESSVCTIAGTYSLVSATALQLVVTDSTCTNVPASPLNYRFDAAAATVTYLEGTGADGTVYAAADCPAEIGRTSRRERVCPVA